MPARGPLVLTPRKTPRQARSEATVKAIFDATVQVLIAHGIGRLTTTRVAERAGVSVGTMYQYFPHKEALLRAIVERYLNQVVETVEKCCADNKGEAVANVSDALVIAYIDAKGRDTDASRALYAASTGLEVADLVHATFRRLHIAASQLLESCPDARFGNVEHVVFCLMASLTGATRVVFESEATPEILGPYRQQMLAMCREFLVSAQGNDNLTTEPLPSATSQLSSRL